MNKCAILLLLSLAATAAEPKFHFQDCVTVVSGFYKGCHGRVMALSNVNVGPGNTSTLFDVSLMCKNNESAFQTFREAEIKLSPRSCDAN